MNRIDRLTAILIQLQTKRIVKAEEIAERFEISLRTVYRDVKALMEAGVPIGSEAGKGYFIVDGYHLPPVMFTQDEASAMLLAGKLVEKMTDRSIRTAFESALGKIKAVLNDTEKDHLENLQDHIQVLYQPREHGQADFPDHFLTDIQKSVVNKSVIRINYCKGYTDENSVRDVEPIGLFYYGTAWHLIAWCRLRNGYRDFRADRIQSLTVTGEKFDARNLVSLQEYFDTVVQGHGDMHRVVVVMDKLQARYVHGARYAYGFISEEDAGDRVRMTFMVNSLRYFCKWMLMFGTTADVESPEEARILVADMVDELHAHYRSHLVEHQAST